MPSPGFAPGEYKDYKTLTSRSSKSKGSVMSPLNMFYCHLLKAEIVEMEKEESKKNQHKNFCLKKKKTELEECADSLMNWDHI